MIMNALVSTTVSFNQRIKHSTRTIDDTVKYVMA